MLFIDHTSFIWFFNFINVISLSSNFGDNKPCLGRPPKSLRVPNLVMNLTSRFEVHGIIQIKPKQSNHH